MNFVYQKDLICLVQVQNNLCEFTIQEQKLILYSKTGF